MAGDWTITFTFKAEDPNTAGLFREALHAIAENFVGVTNVDVEATQVVDLRGVR